MKLAEYEYSIKCKPDKKNALSRSSTEEIADEIKNMYPLQAKRVLFMYLTNQMPWITKN